MGAGVFEQNRSEQGRSKGAEVDGEVEIAKDPAQEVPVAGSKLVAHMGGDTVLDTPGAHGNQAEPGGETHARVVEGQNKVAQAIHARQDENGSVFAEVDVREQGAEQWREVDRGGKKVVPGLCLDVGHDIRGAAAVHQVAGHEHD